MPRKMHLAQYLMHSPNMALRYAAQPPMHDPVPLLAWRAAATSRIGLATTFAVSQQHPFYVARLFATLDHLTRGRVGVLPVGN